MTIFSFEYLLFDFTENNRGDYLGYFRALDIKASTAGVFTDVFN